MPRGARPGERRGGRAKGTPNKMKFESLRKMRARLAKLEPKAIAAVEAALSPKEETKDRLKAAELIFERLYGKPTQSVSFTEIDEETGDERESNEIVFRIVKSDQK